VLVCASRVVLGAHFVSDVLAGALVGSLPTVFFARFLATRRLVFLFSDKGALALRGPGAAKTLRAWCSRGSGAA
jgi:membrane-associated phospholipid phosphatase